MLMQDVGCIACRMVGVFGEPCQIHHITNLGKRVGGKEQHQYTLGLCPWHHQGHYKEGYNERDMVAMLGPSLELHKRAFVERFGAETLLLDVQNVLIENQRAMN